MSAVAGAQEVSSGDAELDAALQLALEGADPDHEAFLDAYKSLFHAWVRRPESLNEEFDTIEVVRRFHERRLELELDQEPFAFANWYHHTWRVWNDGRTDEVVAVLEVMLASFRDDSPYAALLWMDLSGYHRQLGDPDRGAECMRRAAEMIPAIEPGRDGLSRLRGLFSTNRAFDLLSRGLLEQAAPHIDEALDAAREFRREENDPSLLLDAYHARIARALLLYQDELVLSWMESEELREAIHHEKAPSILVRLIRMRGLMALSRLEQRDPDRPRRALDQLRSLGEEMGEEDAVGEHIRLWSRVAVCAMRDGLLDDATRALERAESHLPAEADSISPERARLIAHRTRLIRLRSADPEELAARLSVMRGAFDASVERWMGREVLNTGQAFLVFASTLEIVSEYVALLVAVHGPRDGALRALDALGRLQAIGSLSRTIGGEGAPIEEVQRRLGAEGRGFLYLLPGPDKSFALLLGPGGALCAELEPRVELEQSRAELLEVLDALPFGTDPRYGPELLAERCSASARLLLTAEVRAELESWRELTVVAADHFGFLPFEVLPWDDSTMLGERFAVSYLPSFPVGLALQSRRDGRPLPAAGDLVANIVVPFEEASTDGLAFGDHERELLLDAWPFGALQVAAGSSATLGALSDGSLAGSGFVQIVAHGERDASSARPFGVELFDGVLTPEAAEELDAPPFVSVLACRTWRGPRRRGDDGRDHLAGALLLAGADALYVSHTRIDYYVGLELAREACAAMAEGLSPAEAMRRARLEVGRRSPEARWNASLVHAYGLGHAPIAEGVPASSPRRPWRLLVLGLGALVLTIPTLRFLRRRRHRPSSRAPR